ncbi:hypothetical protein [Clostridium sp. C8-1-8]|uniref:hypothetical protein n=1 Tax=Clostridium sp. C8-1-8 TaxID=2698831 RepID=UPI001370A7AB|nr:hypothetical protein [Clostridium sp. C8-1-8]
MTNNKIVSKYSYLIPFGVASLLPTFNLAFIQKGNNIDKAFFFAILILYVLAIAAIIFRNKKH